MNACTLRFVTQSAGSTRTETASGFMERTETGFSVSYRLLQDEAQFSVSRGELRMARRGDVTHDARFLRKHDSLISTTLGGMAGEIPVHTDDLYVEEQAARITVFLDYRMVGAYSERIRLTIFISFPEVL